MAKRLIYEVLMQTSDGPRSLGFFTDDFLATQAVNHLYDMLRQAILRNDETVAVISEAVNAIGWEQWYPNNRNGDAVFSFRPATLYNSVPSNVVNFTFVEQQDVLPF